MSESKIFLVYIFMFFVGGCSALSVAGVGPGRVDIGGTYTVDAQYPWIVEELRGSNRFYWTKSRYDQNRLMFLSHIEDGEKIFPYKSRMFRPFKKEMHLIQIAKLFAEYIQLGGWRNFKTPRVELAKFGHLEGFRIEMSMTSQGGEPYQALAAGTVIEKELFVICFLAQTNDFSKYLEQAQALIRSIDIY